MILVVVAHPDDESFFMGGTIAQSVDDGELVSVLALSDGTNSRPKAVPSDNARRREHFARACAALGIARAVLTETFPDQQSDTVSQLTINRAVEDRIAEIQPDAVYTHHVGDLNLDHRRVAEAVLVATRGVCPVFSMVPEWPSRCVGPAWEPDITRDIWRELPRKVSACLCYEDEIRPYPHPRSEKAIRSQQYEQFMVIQ